MPPTTLLICIYMLFLSRVVSKPVNDVSFNSSPIARAQPPIHLKDPKRGLSFHNTDYLQNWGGAGSQVSWAYNWDSSMPAAFPKNLEYIPMLWSDDEEHTNQWAANANAAIARGSSHLLSFNEPDRCANGGSCMSARDAADAYRRFMNPFAGRAYLGAPAVTNAPSGMKWLKEFLSLCNGCHIGFVPIHWYDSATNIAYFKNYIADAHDIAGHDLWITEFNGSGTSSEKESFLRTVIPWLDAQAYVTRYSWYWCDAKSTLGAIVDRKGNPTSLGRVYGYLAV